MTWQDELRRLDEELAAGRLSAEEYRQLRDALLGTSAQQPAQETGENSEAATQRSPFPPPFRWDQQPTDRTQAMPPVPGAGPDQPAQRQPGEDADRTQVVSGRPATDAERTQVVPGQPAAGPMEAVFPQYGVPGQQPGGQAVAPWQSGPTNAPPWAGSDPVPPTGAPPAWLRQGPEDFEAEPGGPTLRRVLGIIGVIVLLSGISVGAYFLFRPSQASQSNGQTSVTASPTTQQPTKPPDPPIADLPGEALDMSKVKTFADVEGVNYLTPQEIDVYRRSAAGDTRLAISNDNDVRIIVLATKQSGATPTKVARDELADLQLRFKMETMTTQPGVLAARKDTVSGGPLRRAHYASGQYLVRVQVQGKDVERVDQLFTEVLGAQLDELPADV